MKKLIVLSALAGIVILASCGRDKSKPNDVYMPDMAYSRAYETYASTENLKAAGINYNATPVKGTVKRGELFAFALEKDKDGDSTNYVLSRQVANPLPELDPIQLNEAERLYLVNCGICHGSKLDGNGPLYNDGNGKYPVMPKNLVTLNMPDGQMFYSITYGKNLMGGYGSQMSTTQRWMVINYIKSKQKPAATPAAATAAPAKDTATKK